MSSFNREVNSNDESALTPDYSKYTLEELLDVQQHLDKQAHPERYQQVCHWIDVRQNEPAAEADLPEPVAKLPELRPSLKPWVYAPVILGFLLLIFTFSTELVIYPSINAALNKMTWIVGLGYSAFIFYVMRDSLKRLGDVPIKNRVVVGVYIVPWILGGGTAFSFFKQGLPALWHHATKQGNTQWVEVRVRKTSGYYNQKRCHGKVYIDSFDGKKVSQSICRLQEKHWQSLRKGDKIMLKGQYSDAGFSWTNYRVVKPQR